MMKQKQASFDSFFYWDLASDINAEICKTLPLAQFERTRPVRTKKVRAIKSFFLPKTLPTVRYSLLHTILANFARA